MPVFLLPDLGEGLTEAEIVSWLVSEGDAVTVDQPVVEVETAKATVEVPVPFAGTITKLHGAPGATVAVGAPLVEVQAEAASQTATADETATDQPGLREPGVVTPEPAMPAEVSGSVLIGYGTSVSPRSTRRSRRRTNAPAPVSPEAPTPDPVPPPAPDTAVGVISPLVRRLARDAGLAMATLTGTGPHGIITRADVEAALAARDAEPTAPAAAGPEQSAPDRSAPAAGRRRIPLRGARKHAADTFSRSRREIPEATVWVDVDATGLLAARATLTRPDQRVGVLALLARFAIIGLARYPELNSRVEDDAIVLDPAVHLGFAAQTDRGLVVPVVRDAHQLPTYALAMALADRTGRARSGQLALADLTGGTFTVNNYGVFGVDGSAAIINHPEVAILGMGRILARPWVVDGELAVRPISQLTLAFDHRVCDGGTAGGFLRFVADCVESPVRALGEL